MAPRRRLTPYFPILIVTSLVYSVDQVLSQFPVSTQDLDNWLAATGANVNYRGDSWNNPLGPRDVRFAACTERIPNANRCGGQCYGFQGAQAGQCLPLPEGRTAVCVAATSDVGMCPDRSRCEFAGCFAYVSCKTPLDFGFCAADVQGIDTKNLAIGDPSPSPSSSPSRPPSSSSNSPAPNPIPTPQLSSNVSTRSSTSSETDSETHPSSDSGALSSPSGGMSSFSDSNTRSDTLGSHSTLFRDSLSTGPSPLPGAATGGSDDTTTTGTRFPVGAIVGIVLGCLALLCVILFVLWIRKRRAKQLAASTTTTAVFPPYEPPLTGNATRGSIAQSPSESFPEVQYIAKSPISAGPNPAGNFGQRPEPPVVEITHGDSGVRIDPATFQPTHRTVEHPPPYTQA